MFPKNAFSLVELSIVLVILGLLTGGILTGQSLIRAAELRSVTTQTTQYMTAAYTFRDKYFALPGDMTNATDFWTIAGGTGDNAACQNVASTGTETCNGDGNGQVNHNAVNFGERFRYWQHLANAGLIEGTFTGRDGASTPGDSADANFYVPGQNVPQGKLSNSYFSAAYLGSVTGHANYYDGSGGNLYSFSGVGSLPLNPEEAWNLDSKVDDGRPSSGRITGFKSTGTWSDGCTVAVSGTDQWNVSNESADCSFTVWLK